MDRKPLTVRVWEDLMADDEWLTPSEYLRRSSAHPFMARVNRIMGVLTTRRTVTVATRKYRARKKRKR